MSNLMSNVTILCVCVCLRVQKDGKPGDLPSHEEESKASESAADSQPAEKQVAAADEHGQCI